MKKDNWLIAALFLVASCVFLWLWNALGFSAVDSPTDIVFAVVWWIVIVLMALAIHKAEKKRQERLRLAYIGKSLLFNPEQGTVLVTQGKSTVEVLSEVLDGLEYSFDMKELPEHGKPYFQYVVESHVFAQGGARWEGVVHTVGKPDAKAVPFASRAELASALGC